MEELDYLIDYLLNENHQIKVNKNTETIEEKKRLYRSLCNIREAKAISPKYLLKENKYLQSELKNKNITPVTDIHHLNENYPETTIKNSDKISIWQGDITTLKIDAIVNAANSRGLGCFVPCHNCIDNQINTHAGISLRLECDNIMSKMNYNLPTGEAFITKGYNLPAKHVIHTVGPIINQQVTDMQMKELANCYINSLKLAKENNIKTIAFPCISTGEFRFPKDLAAQIAIKTVDKYLTTNKNFDNIVFNLYNNESVEIYEQIIR